METLLFEDAYLNWAIIGVLLLIIEVSTFTLLLLWLGIAALVMMVISYLMPGMTMTVQLLLFGLLATLAVLIWYFVFKKKQKKLGDNRINNRARRYVGTTATLVEPLENGFAKVKIGDSLWRIRCDEDLAVGDEVEIIDVDGVVLIAKPRHTHDAA